MSVDRAVVTSLMACHSKLPARKRRMAEREGLTLRCSVQAGCDFTTESTATAWHTMMSNGDGRAWQLVRNNSTNNSACAGGTRDIFNYALNEAGFPLAWRGSPKQEWESAYGIVGRFHIWDRDDEVSRVCPPIEDWQARVASARIQAAASFNRNLTSFRNFVRKAIEGFGYLKAMRRFAKSW